MIPILCRVRRADRSLSDLIFDYLYLPTYLPTYLLFPYLPFVGSLYPFIRAYYASLPPPTHIGIHVECPIHTPNRSERAAEPAPSH